MDLDCVNRDQALDNSNIACNDDEVVENIAREITLQEVTQ